VEGLPHLDFNQLQAGARYEGGYSAASPVIQNLWWVAGVLLTSAAPLSVSLAVCVTSLVLPFASKHTHKYSVSGS
jgi:hypothetical protein